MLAYNKILPGVSDLYQLLEMKASSLTWPLKWVFEFVQVNVWYNKHWRFTFTEWRSRLSPHHSSIKFQIKLSTWAPIPNYCCTVGNLYRRDCSWAIPHNSKKIHWQRNIFEPFTSPETFCMAHGQKCLWTLAIIKYLVYCCTLNT
jgi:hypothetical protein